MDAANYPRFMIPKFKPSISLYRLGRTFFIKRSEHMKYFFLDSEIDRLADVLVPQSTKISSGDYRPAQGYRPKVKRCKGCGCSVQPNVKHCLSCVLNDDTVKIEESRQELFKEKKERPNNYSVWFKELFDEMFWR